MSHTPGPWRISASGKVVWADGIKITQQIGPSAASCSVQAAIEETTRANNRLIAAAPEMLELLREMHDFGRPTQFKHQEHAKKVWNDAANLLRKLEPKSAAPMAEPDRGADQ